MSEKEEVDTDVFASFLLEVYHLECRKNSKK
jgi:hypothetical protein